jgi:hypothetical protein
MFSYKEFRVSNIAYFSSEVRVNILINLSVNKKAEKSRTAEILSASQGKLCFVKLNCPFIMNVLRCM